MLFELIVGVAAAAVGYNYFTDKEFRDGTRKTCDKVIEEGRKQTERKYANGQMSDEEYAEYCEKYEHYQNHKSTW